MSYTHLGTYNRVARKARRCDWCWQEIAKGERYVNETCVYDGDFQNHHMHPECHVDLLACAAEEGGVYEWVPGEHERPRATHD